MRRRRRGLCRRHSTHVGRCSAQSVAQALTRAPPRFTAHADFASVQAAHLAHKAASWRDRVRAHVEFYAAIA